MSGTVDVLSTCTGTDLVGLDGREAWIAEDLVGEYLEVSS